jgi:hypothetical protein
MSHACTLHGVFDRGDGDSPYRPVQQAAERECVTYPTGHWPTRTLGKGHYIFLPQLFRTLSTAFAYSKREHDLIIYPNCSKRDQPNYFRLWLREG